MSISFVLGPLTLILDDPAGAPSLDSNDPHTDFVSTGAAHTPHTLPCVVRRDPVPDDYAEAVLAAPVLSRHRSGWKLSRVADDSGSGFRMVAHLHIPPAAPEFQRLLLVDENEATLYCPASADNPDDPLAYLITEVLWLLSLRRMPAALVHAAGVIVHDQAFVLAGSSGAGKSTLASLWKQQDAGSVLADETVMLWSEENNLCAGGTPWPGSAGVYSNLRARVAGLFFLEHGLKNETEELSPAEATAELLSQTFLPLWDRSALETCTDFVTTVTEQVPAYRFRFRPDASAVDALVALA